MIRANRPYVMKDERFSDLYTIEIGVVTRVYPHEKGGDNGLYQCDVRLRDSDQFLPSVQVATQCIGLACTPHVDDMVLVAFVNGDVYTPIIIGTLYSNKVGPPMYREGETVYVCPPAQKSDPPSKELKRFHMELPGGMKLTVREEDVHYELDKFKIDIKKDTSIQLQADQTTITITKEGEITLDCKKKVNIKSTGDITLASSGGNLAFEANEIKIKGRQALDLSSSGTAKIESNMQLSVKAMMLDMKADANAKIEAAAAVMIKGGIVNIN